MKAEELRSVQAPLKEQYRQDPSSAVVTFRVRGRLGEGITCSVETGHALARAGLHPAAGGADLHLCSGDMLLQALVACAGVTMNAVATALGIELRDATLEAEGDVDFRGTLGVDRDAPTGFRSIRLRVSRDTDATDEQKEKLLKLTERYCVVYQTLRSAPPMSIEQTH